MKRAFATKKSEPRKRAKVEVPEYHLTPSRTTSSGEIIWPAPQDQMDAARDFISDCAATNSRILLVPDKDADGLTSGAILRTTLILLGHDPTSILTHFVQKGANIHQDAEREAMAAQEPKHIVVLDQGTRQAPAVIDRPHKALIIDHHHAAGEQDFPHGSQHVSACDSPPVATSSLLTYLICRDLHPDVEAQCAWLAVIGTHGDLGTTLKWEPPFPDMKAVFKQHTKKAINDAVSLLNAPRRTAAYNVSAAWEALVVADSPAELLKNSALLKARAEVNAEVERCTHTPPSFSADGRIAIMRITSAAQVHPVIATRWAGHLASSKLEVVLVANDGYLPGMINFSCRIARCARARDEPVNIIKVLEDVVATAKDSSLRARLGQSFARGHKEASGGIVPKEEFEEFLALLEVQRREKKEQKKKAPSNTITNYFGSKAS